MSEGSGSGVMPGAQGGHAASSARRSKRAHEAILTAAVQLLDERPYADVCIEAIAARAGCGKQTIYRWWPSKAAVLMEAWALRAARETPVPDTGSVEQDLRQYLSHVFAYMSSHVSPSVLAGLLAEAQGDQELAHQFQERLVSQRRAMVRQILERGVNRGELRRDVDIELIQDLAGGVLWYRILFTKAPLDQAFADRVVHQLMEGMATEGR